MSGRSTAPRELPPVRAATPSEVEGILESERHVLVVVYLWGPDCPNCDFFAGRLPALWTELAGERVLLVKVDAYAHPEFARRHGVFGIPHFLLFRDGKKLGKMSEFRGDGFWLGVIRDHLPPSQAGTHSP